jgi:hypothetical protein
MGVAIDTLEFEEDKFAAVGFGVGGIMRIRREIALLVACVLMSSSRIATAQPAGPAQPATPPAVIENGLDYIPVTRTLQASPKLQMSAALGWRSDIEEPTTQCVQAAVISQHNYSQNSLFYRVDTQYALQKALGVSASASAKYYGASGNASYNLAENYSFGRDTINIVGTQSSTSDTDLVDQHQGVSLKEAELSLLRTDPGAFLKRCGDSYVTAVVHGVQFAMSLALTDIAETDFRSMSAKVGGCAHRHPSRCVASLLLRVMREGPTRAKPLSREGWITSSSSGELDQLPVAAQFAFDDGRMTFPSA